MKKVILLLLLAFSLFFTALPALAQEKTPLKGNECLYQDSFTNVKNVVTIRCLEPIFYNAVYWLIIFAGIIAVIFIIFGGIKYLTSGGDQSRIESGKKTLTWAVIGLVVIISSFMIVNIIADLTGVNCISNFGFRSCKTADPLDVIYQGNCRPPCSGNQKCRPIGNDSYACFPPCGGNNIGYCPSGFICTKNAQDKYECGKP